MFGRSIRNLQDNVPSEAPIAGLRDASDAASCGAQRPAGSAEKSLVSSSAESLYRYTNSAADLDDSHRHPPPSDCFLFGNSPCHRNPLPTWISGPPAWRSALSNDGSTLLASTGTYAQSFPSFLTPACNVGREVLAVPLPRRPLFPGGLMPVTVSNEKLIQELIQLKKNGCALC